MGYSLYQLPAFEVGNTVLQQMAQLVRKTWPKDDFTVEDQLAFWRQMDAVADAAEYSYILGDEKNLLGMARTFGRWIQVADVRYHAMALSSVVVCEEVRGSGIGREIVRGAFSRVDKGEFHLSIFQTGVPEFYQKLGCVKIENQIINSLSNTPQENPFWDKYVMCYPRVAFEQTDIIDLHGAGY